MQYSKFMFWSKWKEKGKGLPFKNRDEKNPALIVIMMHVFIEHYISDTGGGNCINLSSIKREATE